MHQKNAAAAASRDENGEGEKDDKAESGEGERLTNPFADDEDDEENSSDEDDGGRQGPGAAGVMSGAWGQSDQASWWRGGGQQGQSAEFDGQDDSDADEEDEEFGDFAMPEVEPAPGTDPNDKSILRPLAVYPSPGGAGGKAFGGLWPFAGKKDGKDDKPDADNGSTDDAATGDDEKPVQAAIEAARRTSIEDPDDEEEVVVQKPSGL
ncbi:hypothetical protein CGRA01v4_13272 [Colletotrichum graminicola]|uniref:SIT4 phosphatase-associated protein n=1 Tax=Colletotrichum graminicola (strain M1.001 / M2 / FGSC 10212) TaxID=645133 RepID=E3QQE5_COLGM|nr:uncharacterized protein GLRG_08227 [Colletotrichum graminicola M1.001]EFQ33083.1 hypothetical protein GLRG_08227 [Colletotrichum graminicola M1.001]WDK21982.1 hypothetical protein CGRA01v4_13272 [Colletotrichum graminicola]